MRSARRYETTEMEIAPELQVSSREARLWVHEDHPSAVDLRAGSCVDLLIVLLYRSWHANAACNRV